MQAHKPSPHGASKFPHEDNYVNELRDGLFAMAPITDATLREPTGYA